MRKKSQRLDGRRDMSAEISEKYPDKDAYLSPNDVAEVLGFTGEAVKQWIYHRRLPAVKLANGYWKVRVGDLESYLKTKYDIRRKTLLFHCPQLDKMATEAGLSTITSNGYADAVLKSMECRPSIFIVDAGHAEAFKLIKRIRAEKVLRHSAVMLVGKLNGNEIEIAVGLRVQCIAESDEAVGVEIRRII